VAEFNVLRNDPPFKALYYKEPLLPFLLNEHHNKSSEAKINTYVRYMCIDGDRFSIRRPLLSKTTSHKNMLQAYI
jgi:hypothetical protein